MATAVNPASELSIIGSTSFAEVAECLRSVTVQVITGDGYGRVGSGSGVVWSADGLVITNAHVVAASRVAVEFQSGRRYPAEVLHRDREHDLAALQIRGAIFSPASIRDAGTLRIGELVVAMGNPLGEIGAITAGVVHSRGSGDYIESDVHLAPGNSGGPLADAEGRIVGINTLIANGMGVAIGTRKITEFVASLLREQPNWQH